MKLSVNIIIFLLACISSLIFHLVSTQNVGLNEQSYTDSLVEAVKKCRNIGGIEGCNKFALEMAKEKNKSGIKADISKTPLLNVLLVASESSNSKQLVSDYLNECIALRATQRNYDDLYPAEAMRYQTLLTLHRAVEYIANQVNLNLVPEPEEAKLKVQMPVMSHDERDEPEFVRKGLSNILRMLKSIDSSYPFDLPGSSRSKKLQEKPLVL